MKSILHSESRKTKCYLVILLIFSFIEQIQKDISNLRRVDRGRVYLRIEIILIDPHPNVRIDEDGTDLKAATESFS